MMNIVEYAEFLVKSICKEPDLVKVSSYTGEEDMTILDILIPESAMGSVIGKSGRNASALRTLIQAYAYVNKKGLVKKAICAHLGMGKLFGEAVGNNEFPAFGLPLGVLNHLLRAIAGKEVGIITKIGLDTFADARIDACCINDLAKREEPIVDTIKIGGEDYLFYKSFPIDVALIKATYADEKGNISFEHEAVI